MIRGLEAEALALAIHDAEDDGRLWAVLVAHLDGPTELHSHEGALLLSGQAMLEPFVRECLLVPTAVDCLVAARAGLVTINGCSRCDDEHG